MHYNSYSTRTGIMSAASIGCSTQTEQHSRLLDISRQLACMKLGSRGKYQPMQYCWVHTSWLLGYLVHTCHLPIDIQQILYCSTQTGQHSCLQRSCCPVWVLQPILAALMLSCLGSANANGMYNYIN